MLTEHELLSIYLGRAAHVVGSEMYFAPDVALEFLAACEENNLALIGIEAFVFQDPELMPQLDLIAGRSRPSAKTWRTFRDGCNQSARAFLEQLPARENLVLSLTVLARNKWKKN
jgi:hypothetical protein